MMIKLKELLLKNKAPVKNNIKRLKQIHQGGNSGSEETVTEKSTPPVKKNTHTRFNQIGDSCSKERLI